MLRACGPGHLRASQTCYCSISCGLNPRIPLRSNSSCNHIVIDATGLFSRTESRSLSELSRQITPPTKNGHAPPPTESRKSYQSVHPTSVRTGWDSPCWVKLSRRLHSWWCPSVNSFKFQSWDHIPPRTNLEFPEDSREGQYNKPPPIVGRHRLWSELGRYLIVFEPLTFVLD